MTGHANGTRTDDPDVYTVGYDGDEPLSTVVVLAVAEAAGVDAHEIEETLYEVVDPDGLDDIFRSADGGADCEVSFTLADHRVTVTSDAITVEPRDA